MCLSAPTVRPNNNDNNNYHQRSKTESTDRRLLLKRLRTLAETTGPRQAWRLLLTCSVLTFTASKCSRDQTADHLSGGGCRWNNATLCVPGCFLNHPKLLPPTESTSSHTLGPQRVGVRCSRRLEGGGQKSINRCEAHSDTRVRRRSWTSGQLSLPLSPPPERQRGRQAATHRVSKHQLKLCQGLNHRRGSDNNSPGGCKRNLGSLSRTDQEKVRFPGLFFFFFVVCPPAFCRDCFIQTARK